MTQKKQHNGNVPGGEGRYFGKWPLSGRSPWEREISPRFNVEYQPLPQPTGPYPYHLDLADVLTKQDMQEINTQGELVFHLTGDVGGAGKPEPQHLVATAMEQDFKAGTPRPRFLYIVGDVVYYYGEAKEYYSQFYEPYTTYPAPIFAIPGNHDGMVAPCSLAPSLKAFMDNFCAPRPHLTPESGDTGRDAMTQPHCYWTLTTPYATLIGIYTNVIKDGELDTTQIAWLRSELAASDPNKALILAMHQPALSLGVLHSGSKYIYDLLDDAIEQSSRVPHMIVAGHSHNYQRFTRIWPRGQKTPYLVPYIVAGAGGHWQLQGLKADQVDPQDKDISLEEHVDDQHGYLRLTVNRGELRGEYFAVPTSQRSWRRSLEAVDSPSLADSFCLDLTTHQFRGDPVIPSS